MNRTRSMYLGDAQVVIGSTVRVPGTRPPRSLRRRIAAWLRRGWARRHALGVEFVAALAVASTMIFAALLMLSPWLARAFR